jgi:hypothetical protein
MRPGGRVAPGMSDQRDLGITDEELDELILGRLRNRREAAHANLAAAATQSSGDLDSSFNESEDRVDERVRVLVSEGRIRESEAAPGRWMIV